MRRAARRPHAGQLPAYAPEINPVENVWNHLKRIELRSLCGQSLVELKEEPAPSNGATATQRQIIPGCFKEVGLY